MELTEASESGSPASNVCSVGESASSHSQLLSVAGSFDDTMVFTHPQQQQRQQQKIAGELNQTVPLEGDTSSQHPWDNQLPTVGSFEAGGAELSAGASRADWELKGHYWDLDSMLLLQHGRGMSGGKRASEWAITEGDESEVAGFIQRENFLMGLQSGASKSSVLSSSSGIPGVAATARGAYGKLSSPERNTAFAHGIEQNSNSQLEKQQQQNPVQQPTAGRENPKVVGFLGLKDTAPAKTEDQTNVEEKDTCSNGGTGADCFIGLKLGKRTYFGDTAAVSAGRTAGMSTSVTQPASSSLPGKKRGSAAAQMPRCQVEGCKLDLSTAKDYHRRHKVCAVHSKAAKVIVASIEQRFCQQCSRFHVLSEFDEGKRSCRRRLAGHNERRRKPQPDPLALASTGASMFGGDYGRSPGINFVDGRRHLHGFGEPHYLWQQLQHTLPTYDNANDRLNYLPGTYSRFGNLSSHSSLGSQLPIPFITDRYMSTLSKPAADRLLTLLQQHPKALPGNFEEHRGYQFQRGSGPISQVLSLLPSSGNRFLEGLEASSQASHCFSELSDTGCALSLLSSQPWGSMTPGSSSMDLSSKPHPLLERMITENQNPISLQSGHKTLAGARHDYGGVTDDPLFIQPLSQRADALPPGIPPNGFRANTSTPVLTDIENHSMLSLPQGHDCRAVHNSLQHYIRPTIDLMESSSSQSCHSHPGPVHTASREFPDFQSSRPFDAMYGAHSLL